MNHHKWIGRWLLTSVTITLLFLAALAWASRLTNPQVPQGGSNSFPVTGEDMPLNPSHSPTLWGVYLGGTEIAYDGAPAGWTVSYSSTSGNLTVTAPSSATVTTNYEARYWTTTINPIEPRSAYFDVIAGGGSAPAAPTGLTATAGAGFVTLSWTGSTGATSYNVMRSTTSGSGYVTVLSPTATSVSDTGVTNGTTYYYVVTAVNSNGTSGYSNQASATPQGIAPSAPTNLAATAGNTQVSLTWTGSTGAASYNVKRSTTNGSGYVTIQSITGTIFTDTGLTNGTAYYYVVTAVNAYGESLNSNQATASPSPGAPLPPAGLSATAFSGEVVLSWTASVGATSYNVKRSTANGSGYATIQSPPNNFATDTTVTNGTPYYYVVTAVNSYGESGNSNQAAATPQATTGNQFQGVICIERVEEWKSQTTYAAVNGSLQTSTGMHVVRAILEVGGQPVINGSTSVQYQGQWVSCPWVLDSYSYTVGAVTPAQMGAVISGSNLQPAFASIPTGPGTTQPGVSIALSGNGQVPIQISSSGPIAGGSVLQVSVALHAAVHYVDPNSGQNVSVPWQVPYELYPLNLAELMLQGSPIDTRRAFGQPNLAGELAGDANAPNRSVNFAGWTYNGGNFVGNMPFGSSQDQSGLSRLQFWTNGGASSGTILAATAVMFDMGAPATATGAETVGVYMPDGSETQLYPTGSQGYPNNLPSQGLTWATRWTSINPTASPGQTVDYANTPVSTLSLSATSTNDYLNWIIADTTNGGWYIPPEASSYIAFCLTSETSGPSWHYFGSAGFSSLGMAFPMNDCQPRLWWLTLATPTLWSQTN